VPPESEAPTGFTFGSDVALSGNRLLIANGFNGDFSDGLPPFAYLYEGHTTWGLKAILPNNFYYVTSIFLSGATAIVSADDEAYGRPGFIYELPLLGSIPDGPPEHP
jgi:hypothetical protein